MLINKINHYYYFSANTHLYFHSFDRVKHSLIIKNFIAWLHQCVRVLVVWLAHNPQPHTLADAHLDLDGFDVACGATAHTSHSIFLVKIHGFCVLEALSEVFHGASELIRAREFLKRSLTFLCSLECTLSYLSGLLVIIVNYHLAEQIYITHRLIPYLVQGLREILGQYVCFCGLHWQSELRRLALIRQTSTKLGRTILDHDRGTFV